MNSLKIWFWVSCLWCSGWGRARFSRLLSPTRRRIRGRRRCGVILGDGYASHRVREQQQDRNQKQTAASHLAFPSKSVPGLGYRIAGAGRRKYIGVRPVLAFWEQCLPITIVFQSESGSFPTVPGENDLEIHRKALN
jgi:hypothetical protein